MPFRLLAAVFCLTLYCTTACGAAEAPGTANWPGWMGPNLDGISTETGWSTDWPESGLPIVWTRQIGIGFSSVSIVDGLLYTMGHDSGQEVVWCLDAATGAEVWSHRYSAERNAHLYEGGPGSTPTVHEDFVFTLGVDGRLLCLQRKTGDVVWEKELQVDLGVEMHEWGFNSSPVLLGDQLIVQGGRIVSYDRNTGERNWQTSRHRAGYGSIRSFKYDGKWLLASLDCDGLRISAATDGSEVAFVAWTSPFRTNSTTPIIVDDTIYISSGYNVGCGLFRLNGTTLETIYTSRDMRNHFNNSILYDGYLYGFDGNSNLGRVVTLTCLEYATGKLMWKHRGLGCGSLMIADGKLLLLSERGDLVLAEAAPARYTEIARSKFLDGRCWTVPTLLNGKVFGRNAAGTLKCVSLPR